MFVLNTDMYSVRFPSPSARHTGSAATAARGGPLPPGRRVRKAQVTGKAPQAREHGGPGEGRRAPRRGRVRARSGATGPRAEPRAGVTCGPPATALGRSARRPHKGRSPAAALPRAAPGPTPPRRAHFLSGQIQSPSLTRKFLVDILDASSTAARSDVPTGAAGPRAGLSARRRTRPPLWGRADGEGHPAASLAPPSGDDAREPAARPEARPRGGLTAIPSRRRGDSPARWPSQRRAGRHSAAGAAERPADRRTPEKRTSASGAGLGSQGRKWLAGLGSMGFGVA